MVADVLLALSQTKEIELTIVVTREPSVAEAALAIGAIVVEDVSENGTVRSRPLGVHRALEEGIERVLCVPGDCPALDPTELAELLAPRPRPASSVVIVPDRHGTGTNGLLLTLRTRSSRASGPTAASATARCAAERALECRIERLSSLLLDIDTGADLKVLRERLSEHAGRAARTRSVLDSSHSADALTGASLA